MRIYIGSDHRGFSLKNKLVSDLVARNSVDIVDLGPKVYEPEDDFNDSAINVSKAILNSDTKPCFGILICGSAIGVSIQANRFKGIRAAVCSDIETAESSRAHNDANILCLSADFLARAKDPLEKEKTYEDIYAIVEKFLSTEFLGEKRLIRRIKRLDKEV